MNNATEMERRSFKARQGAAVGRPDDGRAFRQVPRSPPKEILMSTPSRKDAAVSFLRLVASGKVREAYRAHVGPGFRHHNPYFKGDAASLMAAMEENAAMTPDKVLEVQRALEDGDLVAVHSRVRQRPDDPGGAVVHIFRFEGDRVVELWDVGQDVPPDSPNEHGMF
jgi:predicted SnoaL-like aldol condensation-catalyzing enzyme